MTRAAAGAAGPGARGRGGRQGSLRWDPSWRAPITPSKNEEDVPLAVWPQSLGEDALWIDAHVDEAVDGVLHWDRALGPQTLSSMEVERSSSMVSGSSSPTGQRARSPRESKKSSAMRWTREAQQN